jgi:hypothetical protein
MSVAVSSRDEMGFARIIYETMMIVLIALEPVKNSYLKKLVKRLLVVFILGEFMIFAKVFVTYMDISDEWTPIIWRIYEIIRVFISLSLCYPISLFIGENGQKLQRLFFIVCCLVASGAISDHLHYNNGHSGLNHVASMLIFLFTFYQYTQLRRETIGEIPRLKSLMVLELILIILDGILIVLYFNGGNQPKFLSGMKIALGILQYQKFYMMILVMTHFD